MQVWGSSLSNLAAEGPPQEFTAREARQDSAEDQKTVEVAPTASTSSMTLLNEYWQSRKLGMNQVFTACLA